MRKSLLGILCLMLALCCTGCFQMPQILLPGTDTGTGTTPGSSVMQSAGGASVTDTETSDKTTDTDIPAPHDILKTPIGQLTADEQKELADYLFETYVPCVSGLFADGTKVSSSAVWLSVNALNKAVDNDESEQSRTLDKVLEKVKIYYPDATFTPQSVPLYDEGTKTFRAPAGEEKEYELLSYEVKENTVTLYYQDKPNEASFNTPMQYAVTLKNASTPGYFAFVSSVKSGAVG